MEKKTKMNLSFFTFHLKEKSSSRRETVRHVFANARAGNKVYIILGAPSLRLVLQRIDFLFSCDMKLKNLWKFI